LEKRREELDVDYQKYWDKVLNRFVGSDEELKANRAKKNINEKNVNSDEKDDRWNTESSQVKTPKPSGSASKKVVYQPKM